MNFLLFERWRGLAAIWYGLAHNEMIIRPKYPLPLRPQFKQNSIIMQTEIKREGAKARRHKNESPSLRACEAIQRQVPVRIASFLASILRKIDQCVALRSEAMTEHVTTTSHQLQRRIKVTMASLPLQCRMKAKTARLLREVEVSLPFQSAPKSNRTNSKVNRANAQSRLSGILFALANGKLYFECLKIFSVPENHLPQRGRTHSEVARSLIQLFN